MKMLDFDGKIKVRRKDLKVSAVVEGLINLPSSEVKSFFEGIGLTIPKSLRMQVLQSVLDEPVNQTLEERSHLADELGYRLTWVEFFTEYQLENLVKFFDSASLNKKYLSELWLALLSYMVDKKVDDKELLKLIDKARGFKQLPEDILAYNLDLKDLFFDIDEQIDGVTQDQFRTVLYKSSTVVEIREIGLKYGVDVPKRLKKDELASIILNVLKNRGEYTLEVEEKVRSLSIVLLQRFAKDNEIKASIELKKEDVIEYILSNANQTKEKYFLPSDSAVYEVELRDLDKLATKVKPEPVLEAPVQEQPVQEEPVVIEEKPVIQKPKKVVVEEKVVVKKAKHSPQYEEVVRELELLRAELLDHINNCKCTQALREENKQ
ncbi:MAG: hypothetical protein ACOX56_01360 [Acholeplasmataceae bacterium]